MRQGRRTTRVLLTTAAAGAAAGLVPPVVHAAPVAVAPGLIRTADDSSCEMDDVGEAIANSAAVQRARNGERRAVRRLTHALALEAVARRSLRRATASGSAAQQDRARAAYAHARAYTATARKLRMRAHRAVLAAVRAERARVLAACLPPTPVVPPPPPPPPTPVGSAPTGLLADSATALATGAFRLRWTPVTGATSYEVRRNGVVLGTSATAAYRPATTALNARSSYTVVAISPGGRSAPSAAVAAGRYVGKGVLDQQGRTVYGTVVVSLAVTGTKATGCWATYPNTGSSGLLNNPAVPVLCREAIAAQSAAIASVASASALSTAFVGSLQDAFTKAGI